MKAWLFPVVLSVIGGLSACGGGGGGGTATSSVTTASSATTYTGAVTQASVTNTNAKPLAGSVSGGSTATTSLAAAGVIHANTDNRVNAVVHLPRLAAMSRDFVGSLAQLPVAGALQTINTTTQGPLGGSVTLTGQIDDVTGTGNATAVFTSYKDVGNVTIDGTLTMTITAFDTAQSMPTDMLLNFKAVTMVDNTGNITISGTIRDQITIAASREVMTANVIASDNTAGTQEKLENFVVDQTYDSIFTPNSASMVMHGRVFHSAEGYVDVSTVAPLIVANLVTDAFPSSGGPLLLSGATGVASATAVRVTPISTTNVLLEADTTGDGVYDYNAGTIAWTSL